MKPITTFHGEYRFLSNFWPAEVKSCGWTYRTVEHAYQAAKSDQLMDRLMIQKCKTPGQAKRAGKRITLCSRWACPEERIATMLTLLRSKFSAEPLKALLEETGDAILIEGNTFGDCFWGVCAGVGENHLGKLLMQVREENR